MQIKPDVKYSPDEVSDQQILQAQGRFALADRPEALQRRLLSPDELHGFDVRAGSAPASSAARRAAGGQHGLYQYDAVRQFWGLRMAGGGGGLAAE